MVTQHKLYSLNKKIVGVLIIFLLLFFSTSCKKAEPTDCYEKSFEDAHKHDACPAPCTNVIGCDGKTYCNECTMHTYGIKKTQ